MQWRLSCLAVTWISRQVFDAPCRPQDHTPQPDVTQGLLHLRQRPTSINTPRALHIHPCTCPSDFTDPPPLPLYLTQHSLTAAGRPPGLCTCSSSSPANSSCPPPRPPHTQSPPSLGPGILGPLSTSRSTEYHELPVSISFPHLSKKTWAAGGSWRCMGGSQRKGMSYPVSFTRT